MVWAERKEEHLPLPAGKGLAASVALLNPKYLLKGCVLAETNILRSILNWEKKKKGGESFLLFSSQFTKKRKCLFKRLFYKLFLKYVSHCVKVTCLIVC